jgi:hypothetical protein
VKVWKGRNGGNDIGANGRTEICGTDSKDSKAEQVFKYHNF